MRRRDFIGLAVTVAGGLAAGCGGGGKQEPSRNIGHVDFRFDPPDTRQWDAARSIAIEMSPFGWNLAYWNEPPLVAVLEPGSFIVGRIPVYNVHVVPVKATLHTSEDGTGEPIASAHFLIQTHFPVEGAVIQVPLTVGSEARKLEAGVDRDNQEKLQNWAAAPGWTLMGGEVTAYVRDAKNRIVLTPPGEFVWTSQDTNIATVTNDGNVSLKNFGATTLVARHVPTGLTASVPVKLKELPPPL